MGPSVTSHVARAPRASEAGTSFLECVCAVAILGTSITAGIALYTSQETAFAAQTLDATALSFLKREFEWANAAPYDALVSSSWTPIPGDPRFEVATAVGSTAYSDAREVTVSIRWTTPSGNVRTEDVTTYRYLREGGGS